MAETGKTTNISAFIPASVAASSEISAVSEAETNAPGMKFRRR